MYFVFSYLSHPRAFASSRIEEELRSPNAAQRQSLRQAYSDEATKVLLFLQISKFSVDIFEK